MAFEDGWSTPSGGASSSAPKDIILDLSSSKPRGSSRSKLWALVASSRFSVLFGRQTRNYSTVRESTTPRISESLSTSSVKSDTTVEEVAMPTSVHTPPPPPAEDPEEAIRKAKRIARLERWASSNKMPLTQEFAGLQAPATAAAGSL